MLATPHVDRFINHGLRQHYGELRPLIERMVRSEVPETSRAGARLACLAAFEHDGATDLEEEVLAGSDSQRLGAAQVPYSKSFPLSGSAFRPKDLSRELLLAPRFALSGSPQSI